MHAEQAYLFRHGLLRDAAYQLQLPGDRGRLHALAFAVIEELAGGRPPDPPALEAETFGSFRKHPADLFAEELAEHARLAGTVVDPGGSLQKLYLRRAAEHSAESYQHSRAEAFWRQHADLADATEKGESLRRAADVASSSGRPQAAGILFEQALAEFRRAGNRRLECLALAQLSGMHRQNGHVEEALRGFEQARLLLRNTADRAVEALVLTNFANLLRQTGKTEESERTYRRAIRILRQRGDRRAEGVALSSLASAQQDAGKLGLAERTARRALAIHRSGRDRREEATSLGVLATVLLRREELDEAGLSLALALALHREFGNRRAEGVTLGHAAALCYERGQFEAARTGFDEALAIHREVGNRRFEALHSCHRGLVLLALGAQAEAMECWRTGVAILRGQHDPIFLEGTIRDMRRACAKADIPPFEDGPPAPG